MVTMAMINDVKLSLGNARVTIVGFKIVIPHPPRAAWDFSIAFALGLCPRAQAINPIQPSWVWYNYYITQCIILPISTRYTNPSSLRDIVCHKQVYNNSGCLSSN